MESSELSTNPCRNAQSLNRRVIMSTTSPKTAGGAVTPESKLTMLLFTGSDVMSESKITQKS